MVFASKTISQTARVFSILLLLAGYAPAQDLKIQTEDGATKTLTAAVLSALPHRVIEVKDLHDGKPLKFDAIPLKAVLEKAGVQFEDSLRGKRMGLCLLVEAADGYRAVIALAELDPAFTSGEVFLADGRDHKALDAKEGPYRTVLPGDKKMARWVRQVTELKIVAVHRNSYRRDAENAEFLFLFSVRRPGGESFPTTRAA